MSGAAGFDLLVSDLVLAHPEESRDVIAEIRRALAESERLLGEARLARLRGVVRLWIEWEQRDRQQRPRGAAEFHPSREWLVANGYLAAKANGLEINDVRMFLGATRGEQPFALLHELSHAYDFLVLPGEQPAIEQAYASARASGRYNAVPRVGAQGLHRAYAMTDRREYFAETTEAYLGMNDFFPHIREQLREEDPAGHALMERVWGPQPPRASTPPRACAASLRSAPGNRAATALVVMNHGKAALDLAWIDQQGTSRAPSRLDPGQRTVLSTYEGHVFLATEAGTGQCVGVLLGQERPLAIPVEH